MSHGLPAVQKQKRRTPTVILYPGQRFDPEAWRPFVSDKAALDTEILTVISGGGRFGRLTDDIVERTQRSQSSVSRKVRALIARGLVVHNGITSRARSGRSAMRWIVNPKLGTSVNVLSRSTPDAPLPQMPARKTRSRERGKDEVQSMQKDIGCSRLLAAADESRGTLGEDTPSPRSSG